MNSPRKLTLEDVRENIAHYHKQSGLDVNTLGMLDRWKVGFIWWKKLPPALKDIALTVMEAPTPKQTSELYFNTLRDLKYVSPSVSDGLIPDALFCTTLLPTGVRVSVKIVGRADIEHEIFALSDLSDSCEVILTPKGNIEGWHFKFSPLTFTHGAAVFLDRWVERNTWKNDPTCFDEVKDVT